MNGRAPGVVDRVIRSVTLAMLRHRMWVLVIAVVAIAGCLAAASRLRIDGDFARLLPSESPTAKRFFETLARKGGGSSTIVVVVESPDVDSNQRLATEIESRIRALALPAVKSVEAGPGAVRDFFRKNRWLFAKVSDLERVDCEIEREVARRDPGYLDLGDEGCDPEPERGTATATPTAPSGEQKEGGSPLARVRRELEAKLREVDRFSTGYYRTPEGDAFAVVVRAESAGMGEAGSEGLLAAVERAADSARVPGQHAATRIGFGGDIPTSIAEQKALVDDMTLVSVVAILLILGSIVVFFRSAVALVDIGLCVVLGCALAFAVASFAYGRLNAATSFLTSIIAGNGINSPIVYIARFRELRAGGATLEEAATEAAVSCRKGTFIAALAAAGAYGALLTTNFRAFSEFGLIGACGMLACWAATFLVCPAALAVTDRPLRPRGKSRSAVPSLSSLAASLVGRAPWFVLAGAGLLTAALVLPLQRYLQDPWEYNFSNLRSRASANSGASRASSVVDRILQSRGSPILLLANDAQGAPALAEEVLRADRQSERAPIVEKVETIRDRLGGSPGDVARKLALAKSVRERLDRIERRLSAEDRDFVREWRPPDDLRPLDPGDLPDLLLSQFREATGRVGTPVYVTLDSKLSQSRGENLLRISDVLGRVRLPDGTVAPNASRAAVFAEMIRSMTHDGPRATLLAFFVVVVVTVLVARRVSAVLAVLGSLLAAVAWTVGAAAWLDVRLNFLNFVALPLTFGIGVEYAINLFERIRLCGDVGEGLRSAGGAVMLCSLTTILGYGSLLFADNRALASFGIYAITGELACIVTAMLVMPAALVAANHLRRRRQAALTG